MSNAKFGYAVFENDPYDPYPQPEEQRSVEPIQVIATHHQLRHMNLDRMPDYCPGLPDELVEEWGLGRGDLIEYRANERGLSVVKIVSVNGFSDRQKTRGRQNLSDVIPDFPGPRIPLDQSKSLALRIVDIYAPLGFGQKVVWMGAPESGKTWGMLELVSFSAQTLTEMFPGLYIVVVLVGERPEEIGDFISLVGDKGEVIWSRNDDQPGIQVNIAEVGLARARGLCQNRPVMLFIDSITRLTAAYGATDDKSPWTSGGAGVGALANARIFLGGAGNYPQIDGLDGGSLTVIASALCDGTDKGKEVAADEIVGAGNNKIYYVNPEKKFRDMMLRPSLDLERSHARNEHRFMSQAEQDIRIEIRRILSWADAVTRLRMLIDHLPRCATLESLRDELKKIVQPTGPRITREAVKNSYRGEDERDDTPQRSPRGALAKSADAFTEGDYNRVSGGAYHVSKYQASKFSAAKINPAELKSLIVEKGQALTFIFRLAEGEIEHEKVVDFLEGRLAKEDFHL